MEEKPFFQSIRLRGFLSFGPKSEEIALTPLNVIIGANGSGKSNLIEAMEFLRALPKVEIDAGIRRLGGITECFWKGSVDSSPFELFGLDVRIGGLKSFEATHNLQYSLEIVDFGVPCIFMEELQNIDGFLFQHRGNSATLRERQITDGVAQFTEVAVELTDSSYDENSVFSQIKDKRRYPAITKLGQELTKVRIYRGWDLGRNTPPRQPQPADMLGDFLDEDASNLGMVLNDLHNNPGSRQIILKHLQDFNPVIDDVTTKVNGGTVQIFFHEKGMAKAIPATRVSDGTLQYLCLLCVLCHPTPPPLICIEEPEKGLHPDILPKIAELLIEASERTQLIVTTHSDTLVSALSSLPESVMVCEKSVDGTQMRRLDAERLQGWLEKYSLGELWRMGEIGGTL